MDPLKLVVLGPTGRIGGQVVHRALAAGHSVTAVARRPDAITTDHENLTVVAGDVLDHDALDGAVASADAVVFAVGSVGQGPSIVRSRGVALLSKVMRTNNVRRLVVVSPSAVAISPAAPLTRKLALRYFVHKVYRNPLLDVERMEDELTHTDLDWSVVRASSVHDGPPTGNYEVVPWERVRRERPVSVGDLADFLVRHAADSSARHDIVTVTGEADAR